MAFRLAPDGQVVDARVAKSSGWSLLDAASVRGLSACHFKPRDPQPAEVSREMKMQYVWKLEGPFNHPKVVDGTCEASRKIDRFEPDDTGVTDERGMLVRLLVSAEGRPYGIKAEGDTVSPEGFEQAAAYLQTCRFRTDLGRAGKPTDTVTGRVIYK
jgi:TonB family protein